MKSLKTYLYLTLVLASLGIGIYNAMKSPKVAFVRSTVIIEKYEGLKEARSAYNNKVTVWQSNLDTLKLLYNSKLEHYNSQKNQLSPNDKLELEGSLNLLQQQIYTYTEEINKKSQEENESMTQGALNQVNSYIEQYAESNGYDLVLGVTLSGNILYGRKTIDITDEVLKGLNTSYKK